MNTFYQFISFDFVDQLYSHPEKCLSWVVTVAFSAFLLGTLIPGLVAWFDLVFHQEDLIEKCSKMGLKAVEEWAKTQEHHREQIEDVNRQLAGLSKVIGDSRKVTGLIELRQFLEREREKAKRATLVESFLISDLAYLWWTSYTALAILISLAPLGNVPAGEPSIRAAVIWASAGIFFLVEIPIWSRIFFKPTTGRKVFTFINWDISPASFVMLGLNYFVLSGLLGIVWYRWLQSFHVIRHLPQTPFPSWFMVSHSRQAFFPYSFARWQFSSVVLALAFFAFTTVYWKRVALKEDKRYLVQAATIHVVWGVTWCVISLPAIQLWENSPTGGWTLENVNKAVSLAIAVISFFLPLLKKPPAKKVDT